MTKAEILLWMELKNKGLGERFLRQYSIKSYIVDFFCSSLRLAVEVDGVTHSTEEEIEYDKKRQSEIEELGIIFLRFTNPEVYEEMHKVLESINLKIAELRELQKSKAEPPLEKVEDSRLGFNRQ